MFLRYWNNEPAIAAKFVGNWLLTGDLGERDDQGYIRFIGRDDDVITSGGYSKGPGGVEDCLLVHRTVGLAAGVCVARRVQTERLQACIVAEHGFATPDWL